jgi:hypothetical protein
MKTSLATLVLCLASTWSAVARAEWWCAASTANARDRGCWESKKECEAQMPATRGYSDCKAQAQAAVVSATFRGRGAVNAAFPELSFCEEAKAAWVRDPDAVRVSACSIERSMSRPPPAPRGAPGRAAAGQAPVESPRLPSLESCEGAQEAARQTCDALYKAAAAGLIALERGASDDATKRAARLCGIARSHADATCAATPARAGPRPATTDEIGAASPHQTSTRSPGTR